MKRAIKATERVIKRLDPSLIEIKSIDEEKRIIWHPITREVPDRYGDIVRVDGVNVDDFLRKPAVLYGHDYRSMNPVPVIGSNVGFEKVGDTLYAGTQFLQTADVSQPLADLVNDNFYLQKKKLLGWSIGFLPVDWSEMKDGKQFKGYDFKSSKLLEYSSVVIPAHQDAVNSWLKEQQHADAVAKFFDMHVVEEFEMIEDDAVVEKSDDVLNSDVQHATISNAQDEQDAGPVTIDAAAQSAPAATKQSHQQGGNHMLKTILEKLAKGENLKQEEIDFLTQMEAQRAAGGDMHPARVIERSDGHFASQTRNINEIVNLPARMLNEVERELQTFSDDAYIAATILKTNPRALKMWEQFNSKSSALRKALAEATANAGAEWVPTLLSADFIEKFRLEAKVAALFNDYPMPSNPYKVPYAGGLSASDFYYVGESTSDAPTASPATTMATGDQTLTAKKLKARVVFSDEINEDSIVPVIPTIRAELVRGGAECVEDVLLNGDITATHQDVDVTDSKDRRKAWSGLRKLCPTETKASLATFTAMSHIQAFITLMQKYGINPTDLAFITGGVGYSKFRALTEVITVDKYGPNAVVQTGELGKLLGTPIIVSEYIRENLNATGVYDATTMTKTQVLIVNRRGFMLGSRGTPKLTFKSEGEVDQNQLIMSFRKAFAPRWTPSATVRTIANGYNVA